MRGGRGGMGRVVTEREEREKEMQRYETALIIKTVVFSFFRVRGQPTKNEVTSIFVFFFFKFCWPAKDCLFFHAYRLSTRLFRSFLHSIFSSILSPLKKDSMSILPNIVL